MKAPMKERKLKEIRALADASYEALLEVERAARQRKAKRLEAVATRAR